MIHAYDKMYLGRAQTVLGRMLDFAVYDMEYEIDKFFQLFLESGLAAQFETGDFRLLVGMSGVELAYEVLETLGFHKSRIKPRYTINRSEEYWVGWALAYYQWDTSLHFEEIHRYVSIRDIQDLYSPYHEMDIRQFCDKMNELYKQAKPDTNLKLLRLRAGLTQKELSKESGIPVRTIQQYEQRQKNINKAQAEYLMILAKVLCCKSEELIERII